MKAFNTMFITELKLSLRGMDMFIFAICIPLIVTILIGIIYGSKPAFGLYGEYTFLEQSFGAIATIAIISGGVMGLPLVVSNYRSKKILKRFKVTPISPTVILLVQVVIYLLYSIVSLILIYAVAIFFFEFKFRGSSIQFLGAYFLVMMSIFSIGMMIGGISPNTKTTGILASLLYFPMLIFSGATLPYEIMPRAIQKFADIMPLTQGIKLLKNTSLNIRADNIIISIISLSILTVICIGITFRFFKWE